MAIVTVAQIEIAIPGYPAMSGQIEVAEGELKDITLDAVAIQMHSLTNDLVMSIRKNKVIVDGKEKADGPAGN